MKRNKNLIELSRDHHHGLLLGWKIKQGLKKKVAVEEIVKYLVYFSERALFTHFEAEEHQILVYLKLDDMHRKTVIQEHLEIKMLIKEIQNSSTVHEAALLSLADKLEAHIRYEERVFFPYLESVLPAQDLESIGEKINDIHIPYVENYHHEFWIN